VFVFVLMPLAFGGKLSNDLPKSGSVNVIVQFYREPDAKEAKKLLDIKGAKLNKKFVSVAGFLVTLPAESLPLLEADPDVKYVSLDRPVSKKLDVANPTTGANVAYQAGLDGAGVGVAVLDSGVYASHPDLQGVGKSRVLYSESFVPGDSSTNDGYGHGTHVAGIIAGNAAMSSGLNAKVTFRGMAPRANLVNLRVLDAEGRGSDSAVISAIDRAIALKSTYNIRVMNLSLGRPISESYTLDPLCASVEQAWRAGIVVVTAAGNTGRDNSRKTKGYGTIASPGNSPFVITVGAMRDMGTVVRTDDQMATFSSKGPSIIDHVVKPDIVAPGNAIISAMAPGSTLSGLAPGNVISTTDYLYSSIGAPTKQYLRLSGTSMAAPMVAGAAALMIHKEPYLTPDTVKARLMRTASKTMPRTSSWLDLLSMIAYGLQYDIFTVGAGYLDIVAALNSTVKAPAGSYALSPVATRDPLTGQVTINTTAGLTGYSVVWGSYEDVGALAVWGSNVLLSGTSTVWGSSVVWGSLDGSADALAGNSFIWGMSVVWGSLDEFSDALSVLGEE
jgi:serine protease AprX